MSLGSDVSVIFDQIHCVKFACIWLNNYSIDFDQYILSEKLRKSQTYGAQISGTEVSIKLTFFKESKMRHLMTSNSTYCLIISECIFSGKTLHYVCDIITDNFSQRMSSRVRRK